MSEWTPEKVQRIIADGRHVLQKTVSEAEWFTANKKIAKEMGFENWLRMVVALNAGLMLPEESA